MQTELNKLKRVERERNIAVIQARMGVLTARREFLQKLLFFRLDARDACKKARQVRGTLWAQVQSVGLQSGTECQRLGAGTESPSHCLERVAGLLMGERTFRYGTLRSVVRACEPTGPHGGGGVDGRHDARATTVWPRCTKRST